MTGHSTVSGKNVRSEPATRATLRDQRWLQGQYQSSNNLSARATLHVRFRTNSYPWQRWVFDHIEAGHTARILEIGCGPGPLWMENRDRIPLGWRIWLADLSEGMVAEAVEGLQGMAIVNGDRPLVYGLEYGASVADAQVLPFRTGSFDVVIANHMLYHVGDVNACLGEVQRVLVKGGRFYAATNGADHMRELHDFAYDFEPQLERAHWGRNVFDFDQAFVILPHHFGHVTLHRYPNALHVTEPGPLIAYLLSGILDDSDPEYVERFRRYVIDRLAGDGPLRIHSHSGLFVGVRE